ncbi:MAG: squalene synthase HpnD [Alphaproteobacteria bacterium]|nr:squalene synthase HpnD [Alphaproteobacteria bacterium]
MSNGVASVRAVTLGARSSFLWGMRVLPKARREAMYALYAFCRVVDDIADSVAPRPERLIALAEWRAEIGRLYAGNPLHPVAVALLAPVRDYALPRAEFEAVIDGMEMDAEGDIRAPDRATFDLYCRRVAGAVGMLSIRIFGAQDATADRIALTLGRALQVTNILRDLMEDARGGRLYLPRELLAAHGVAVRETMAMLADPSLPKVCQALAEEALRDYGEVERLLAGADRTVYRPCVLMMQMYRTLLDRLLRSGFRDPKRRVSVPKLVKIWIVLRYGFL